MRVLMMRVEIMLSAVTFHLSPFAFHLSPFTCHLSPVTCHLSPVTCHLSSVTCHLSPVTCHLSPVTCHLPCLLSKHRQTYIATFRLNWPRGRFSEKRCHQLTYLCSSSKVITYSKSKTVLKLHRWFRGYCVKWRLGKVVGFARGGEDFACGGSVINGATPSSF